MCKEKWTNIDQVRENICNKLYNNNNNKIIKNKDK